MQRQAYQRIVEASRDPAAQQRTVLYLAEHLSRFLRKRERVLLCFLDNREGSLCHLMEQAVHRCDAVPVLWGPDHRWKTLLRQTFTSQTTAIIGEPLLVLGLVKLKKHSGTPLPIRRVITTGYPCLDWMVDGIAKGLDCEAGGCFALTGTGIVAGFACGRSWGVHLRQEEYGVDLVDAQGQPVPAGELGEIVLYAKQDPTMRYPLGENARFNTEVCRCGSSVPRLQDMRPGRNTQSDLLELGQYLQSWTSILDCRLSKGECGLEIEIVCFQGEKLPKLPTAAKLVIRSWVPDEDEPFPYCPQ